MSFIGQIQETRSRDLDTSVFTFRVFLSPQGLKKNEMGVILTKYGLPRAKKNVGGARSARMKLPINFLRPVGKRSMGEVVHVAATKLVCSRRQHIWIGYGQGVPSQ